jgi:hypothetical protein
MNMEPLTSQEIAARHGSRHQKITVESPDVQSQEAAIKYYEDRGYMLIKAREPNFSAVRKLL